MLYLKELSLSVNVISIIVTSPLIPLSLSSLEFFYFTIILQNGFLQCVFRSSIIATPNTLSKIYDKDNFFHTNDVNTDDCSLLSSLVGQCNAELASVATNNVPDGYLRAVVTCLYVCPGVLTNTGVMAMPFHLGGRTSCVWHKQTQCVARFDDDNVLVCFDINCRRCCVNEQYKLRGYSILYL